MMKSTFLGKTGQQVSMVGLGGEGVLRTHDRTEEAKSVIETALDEGITYFDCAHVYADSELYYGSVWAAGRYDRSKFFQASKSASRDKQGALKDLDHTLKRLKTDYLDLWQIHDIRTEDDFNKISGSNGALEAFKQAKASGKVRFIGVTGHHDPSILSRAVQEWDVDTVMMPINPIEEIIGGFLTSTLPIAKEKGMGIIAMKILGGSHFILPQLDLTPEFLIQYALSHNVSVGIVGCSAPTEVKTLANIGRTFQPLAETERMQVISRLEPFAKRLAFYRGKL